MKTWEGGALPVGAGLGCAGLIVVHQNSVHSEPQTMAFCRKGSSSNKIH